MNCTGIDLAAGEDVTAVTVRQGDTTVICAHGKEAEELLSWLDNRIKRYPTNDMLRRLRAFVEERK